ncbi:MAG: glycosyltransferase [Candidatus Altiarchaeota archaeon]|nr:glycosyltransferase [Candidatus Altiarchaeota archaeon]
MIEQVLIVLFSFMTMLYLSWIILYFIPRRRFTGDVRYPSLSMILPAHNEENVIEKSLLGGLNSDYPSEKEVIVVDDGSTDKTAEIVRRIMSSDGRVKLLTVSHGGKANAINTGLSQAKGEIVVVVDADSELDSKALLELVRPFSDERVGAVSGVIRARMNDNVLVWYQDLEYMMSSTWRLLCDKLDATYLLPGFTAFRRKALLDVGGFSTDTLAEDFDIGLRVKKAGYRMVMSDAVMYTQVPQDLKSLVRQRVRWSRGTIQVVKKHSDVPFNPEYGAVGFYGIPTQLYWFVHGFVALPISIYQILYGYLTYFVKYSDFVSFNVFKYFFGWISMYGMLEYSFNSFTGVYPMNAFFLLCFVSFFLGVSYNVLSITRYSRLSWRHAFVIFFSFPYSIFALIIFTFPILWELNPLAKKKALVNIWEK